MNGRKQMKKIILIVTTLFFLGMSFVKSEAAEIKQREIFSIKEATWIHNSGMSKGKNHDRQDLGFILPKETVLKVRQANPNYSEELKVRLLGDDREEDKVISVGTSWKEIKGNVPLVPFVETPYGTEGAILEYSVESENEQKILPVYTEKTNSNLFFSLWDKENSEYALIKGKDFQLFLPAKDKELVRNLKDFDSIDELIAYYNDLFAYYNQIAGFDGSSPTNENGMNRYFLRADKNGVGGAYYGSLWTANSKSSTDMWLKKISWGTLHEIGHGYQAGFDGQGMYTGEVSNNLFAAQYEYEKYGKEADTIGWLFDYGKKESVEKNLYTKLVKNNGTYDTVDLREKLILLTMLKQKAGNEAFTKMYQGYRELANLPNFKKSDYELPDLYNQYYSEHSHLDFSPVFKRWDLNFKNNQEEINRLKNYEAIVSLADVVPESQLKNARNLLDDDLLITSNFEMVVNEEIAALGLFGNLTLNLKKSEGLADILESKVHLKNGEQIIDEGTIKGDTITFTNVPNGIYTVEFLNPAIISDQHYVYVKEAENPADIFLSPIENTKLSNQKINFLGYSDTQFGEFETKLSENKGLLTLSKTYAHSYYEGKTYVEVKVTNKAGEVTFEKTIQGTDIEVGTDTVPLNVGDKLEIFHAETKSRLTSSESIIDSTKKRNVWVVTELGLKNEQLQNDPEKDLRMKIDDGIIDLKSNDIIWKAPLYQSDSKKNIRGAIMLFSEQTQAEYAQKYPELFPSSEKGKAFKYTFKGLGDKVFATMNISLEEGSAYIDTNKGKPHSYFNKSYSTIFIQSKHGKVKYKKIYNGNTNYIKEQEKISIEKGDFITVYHAEAKDRLFITNIETGSLLEKKETVTYKVADDGLILTTGVPY